MHPTRLEFYPLVMSAAPLNASTTHDAQPAAKKMKMSSGSPDTTLEDLRTTQARTTLESYQTRGYVKQETPIEPLPRLSAALGGAVEIHVKRDDLLPLAGGGSKTRKLDYLVQQAVDGGYDTLVTCGAVQSNHCRLTASAAAREGLACHLVLEERVKGSYDPNAGVRQSAPSTHATARASTLVHADACPNFRVWCVFPDSAASLVVCARRLRGARALRRATTTSLRSSAPRRKSWASAASTTPSPPSSRR